MELMQVKQDAPTQQDATDKPRFAPGQWVWLRSTPDSLFPGKPAQITGWNPVVMMWRVRFASCEMLAHDNHVIAADDNDATRQLCAVASGIGALRTLAAHLIRCAGEASAQLFRLSQTGLAHPEPINALTEIAESLEQMNRSGLREAGVSSLAAIAAALEQHSIDLATELPCYERLEPAPSTPDEIAQEAANGTRHRNA